MRRILGSFVLLASALFVAGCGGSNANSVPHPGEPSVASLVGQYAFDEQVYTFNDVSAVTPRHGASNRHFLAPMKHVSMVPHRGHPLAGLKARQHPLPALVKNALPNSGDGASPVAWGAEVGSLTFDGDGHVTAGELDFNEPTNPDENGVSEYSENVTGTYTVDPQQVGTISLTGASTGFDYEFQITLQGGTGIATGSQATGAQLLEAEVDELGDVNLGTGQLLQQSSGLAQSTLTGNYIFGVQGVTCLLCTQINMGDLIAAGVLAADGSGNFASGGEADIATAFATDNNVGITGTYTAPDGNGRATAALAATGYTNGVLPSGYVIYIVNSSTAFLMSTDEDSSSVAAPFLFGEMNQQSGTFSSASLTGNAVVAETTEDLQDETVAADTYSDAFLALVTASGGTLTGTADVNQAGTIRSAVPVTYGTYSVASNGRVTLNGTTPSGAAAPVFYLSGTGIGYGVDQLYGTETQEPGLLFLFSQQGSGFSNASLTGNYAFGNLPAAISGVGLNVESDMVGPGFVNGELVADGNGTLSGPGTAIFINGEAGSGDFNGTYAITANGRGTITGSASDPSPLLFSEVFYLAQSGVALAMDVEPGNSSPNIQIIHQ
jgi:hypothetical protein